MDDEGPISTGEIKVAGVIMLSAALADLSKDIRKLTWAIDRMVAREERRREERWWNR